MVHGLGCFAHRGPSQIRDQTHESAGGFFTTEPPGKPQEFYIIKMASQMFLTCPYSPTNLKGIKQYLKEPCSKNNISTLSPKRHEASSWLSSASGPHGVLPQEDSVTGKKLPRSTGAFQKTGFPGLWAGNTFTPLTTRLKWILGKLKQ